MKLIALLFVGFGMLACTNQNDSTMDESSSSIDTHSELPVERDLSIRQRKLRYNNDYFTLKVIPLVDAVSHVYSVNVLLYNEKDTVTNKWISKDSLMNAIMVDHVKPDSIDLIQLKKYQLDAVVPTLGIRGYNTYLIAKLIARDMPDVYIRFAIKAWGDNRSRKGRLWIQGIDYHDEPFNSNLLNSKALY